MIGRKSTISLADALTHRFYRYERGRYSNRYWVHHEALYDFLYEHDYPAWFCNLAASIRDSGGDHASGTRALKEFVLQLQTGESYVQSTPQWTWDQRSALGQEHLRKLAQDLLASATDGDDRAVKLKQTLELDGYLYIDGRLLPSEADILDVHEQVGVLQTMFRDLQLTNEDTTFHHLSLSESHYTAARWDDSISNSRKFLESVLSECANRHSLFATGNPLSTDDLERPARVREYLERSGLLDRNEREAIASIYGLLSATGGHPYMAAGDQARLLRHLALTVSQFVLIRTRGSITPPPS
jgi:hypothetical protein